MARAHRENGRLATLVQVHDLTGLMVDERVLYDDSEALPRKSRDAPARDDSYARRFRRAIAACGCDANDSVLTTKTFPENVFGTLAKKGVLLAQPPISDAVKKRDHWLDSEIDEWFSGKDVLGKALESCFLVDLAKYGEQHPEEQRTKVIVCWRAGKKGLVASLDGNVSTRCFCVYRRKAYWDFNSWFLLRRVR